MPLFTRLSLPLFDAPIAVVSDQDKEAVHHALAILYGTSAEFLRAAPSSHAGHNLEVTVGEGEQQLIFSRRGRRRGVHVAGPGRLIDVLIAVRQVISIWCSTKHDYYHAMVLEMWPKPDLRPESPKLVAIMGASGSGKSTLATKLSKAFGVEIVVEDWGPLSHETKTVIKDGTEATLHLKRATAITYDALIGRELGDDPTDRTRAFYERRNRQHNLPARLAGLLILGSNEQEERLRDFRSDDLQWIEMGSYSSYYGGHERWLDGSTMLFNAQEDSRRRSRMYALASSIPTRVAHVGRDSEKAIKEIEDWFYKVIEE